MSDALDTVGGQNSAIGDQAFKTNEAYKDVLAATSSEEMLEASFTLMTEQNKLTIMTESTSKKRKAELDGQKAAFQSIG